MNPICAKCKQAMSCQVTGVSAAGKSVPNWQRRGDLFRCGGCGAEIVIGFGQPFESEEKADILSRVFAENVRGNPASHSFLLTAVDFGLGPTYSLVISGDTNSPDTIFLLKEAWKHYNPTRSLIFRPTDVEKPLIDKLSNFTSFFTKYHGKATGYVCFNKTCKPPSNDIETIFNYLNPVWRD